MIGIAIFLFILAFATIQYNKLLKRTRYGKEHPEDWLFHDFYLKVYSGFWGAKNPDEVAVKLGIKIDQYYQSCKILRITPNTKKLIVHHIYGLASWFLFGILALLVNIVFIVPGIAVFIYFLILIPKNELILHDSNNYVCLSHFHYTTRLHVRLPIYNY